MPPSLENDATHALFTQPSRNPHLGKPLLRRRPRRRRIRSRRSRRSHIHARRTRRRVYTARITGRRAPCHPLHPVHLSALQIALPMHRHRRHNHIHKECGAQAPIPEAPHKHHPQCALVRVGVLAEVRGVRIRVNDVGAGVRRAGGEGGDEPAQQEDDCADEGRSRGEVGAGVEVKGDEGGEDGEAGADEAAGEEAVAGFLGLVMDWVDGFFLVVGRRKGRT